MDHNGEERLGDRTDVGSSQVADEAFNNHQIIIKIKQSITKNFWNLAVMLKINRDRRYYKTLGYETFEQYLGTPEISLSRGYTFKLIKNYELWVQTYNVSPAKLEGIDSEKLYLAGMIATKDDYEEWIQKAKDLSRSDIRGLIKGEDYEYNIREVECPKCHYKFTISRNEYNV